MVLKIGHRGAWGYEPENTLKSFRLAIELGVDMIECDAHLSKEGKVMIIHDPTLNRTTNGKGKVSNLTRSEIQKLDAGHGEKIPTLEETIDLVRNKCWLNIEVKNKETMEKVCKVIQKKKFKKVVVSSSYTESLVYMKNTCPGVERALVFFSYDNIVKEVVLLFLAVLLPQITRRIIARNARKVGVKRIHLQNLLTTTKTVNFLKQQGYKVHVWTVNNIDRIQKLKQMKVDGIFTNYPDRL